MSLTLRAAAAPIPRDAAIVPPGCRLQYGCGLVRRVVARLWPLLCLGIAGCGADHRADGGIAASIECAPFARALTGVGLSGAAADWWRQANGRYQRTQRPGVGSLLVFRRSGRLPYGHVAVVSQVISGRRITVTQANWQHHHITAGQPVLDVSKDGDWTAVRVWWAPLNQMGSADYATFGFIQPDNPPDHDQLTAATSAAARVTVR